MGDTKMKTIIAGGRDFKDFQYLEACISEVLLYGWNISTVISGAAKGADNLGEAWALSFDIRVQKFPANWEKYGKGAGPRRNEEMAKEAEALIAFWDGESKGTRDIISRALKHNLYIKIFRY